jgi:hypothetical protein
MTAPMQTEATPYPWGWRYLPDGRVRHLVDVSHRDASAVCGRGPWVHDQWRGTGAQREYERCAALPPCRNCLRHRPQAEGWTP